jgi:hypothetical protein
MCIGLSAGLVSSTPSSRSATPKFAVAAVPGGTHLAAAARPVNFRNLLKPADVLKKMAYSAIELRKAAMRTAGLAGLVNSTSSLRPDPAYLRRADKLRPSRRITHGTGRRIAPATGLIPRPLWANFTQVVSIVLSEGHQFMSRRQK